jgi:adenylate cyclase
MQRKLTVIFSADVVGYSALMERDEAGTLSRLKENRKSLFDPRVAAQGGRIFKVMGDGVLIEFPSAASAVTCALDIQAAMDAAEAHRAESERLRYRVGINLGDVIIEGDDIYGEGVNVAARLQALAPAGGVALSRNVRDQVAGKVAAEFEDLGPHNVKNIEGPVHVFSARAQTTGAAPAARDAAWRQKVSICVLPFANMSGDLDQEYFSDGISEDIITDLSKVSALSVIARNSAFAFKGKHVDVLQVARQLNVTHVLEGSVRKAGGRVRITAQLIDGAKNDHVWAERYDRDLDDIFAIQDEISEAIVKALKLKLLPEEKKTIERRGTDNVEAYNLFLMARQEYLTGFEGDPRRVSAIVRLCQRATEIDPNYARAWALLATAQVAALHVAGVAASDNGQAAVERALALDSDLAEAHSVKSRILLEQGRVEDAALEMGIALSLDGESYEVNRNAAVVYFTQRDFAGAIPYYTKAMTLFELDFGSASMLVTCHTALGDHAAARAAAEITLARVEKVLAQDRSNGTAMGHGSDALAVLGQNERAKEWMGRALLIDPENWGMRYNFACCLAVQLKDSTAAIEMLRPVLAHATISRINYAKIDPDFDTLRDDPRFQNLIADAEARATARADGA